MDFGIYPPEVNSGRMYAGPGSGPLMAAAQAWAELSDTLYATASGYQSVVSELTSGFWSGPSAESMAAAAATYVQWLSTTAGQAADMAGQATAAAAAYEAAFAMTVPPPEVAANRTLLATLVATNFLGQNAPAIAATEAQYAEMWAQDAAAMDAYAVASAAATVLTPFASPDQNTTPAGVTDQTAAVTQAASSTVGDAQDVVSAVPQLFAAAPAQSLAAASPTSLSDTLGTLSDLITIFAGFPAGVAQIGVGIPLDILSGPVDLPFAIAGYLVGTHTDNIVSGWNGEQGWPSTDPAPVRGFPATLQGGPGALSAGLGQSKVVGALSVPSGWSVAAEEVRPVALVTPDAAVEAAAAAPLEVTSGSSFSELGLAGMTGRAMAGSATGPTAGKVSGLPVTVFGGNGQKPDADGDASPAEPRRVVTGVAAKIRELAQLRDSGELTEEEYAQLKRRLLGR